MQRIRARLSTLRVGEPVVHREVVLFPLYGEGVGGIPYVTMDEALRENCIAVTEATAQGSVPSLRVVNSGQRPLLMVEGEELIGAKQNRILNASLLVPASSELVVPVSCSEQGRWAETTHACSSDSSSALSVRAAVHRSVSSSLRTTGRSRSDQGTVWAMIQRKLRKLGVSSSTGAMHALYAEYEKELAGYLERLAVPADACGLAVAIGGAVRCVDVFDKPSTLGCLRAKLLRSYAIEAMGQEPTGHPVPASGEVSRLLAQTAAGEWTRHDSPGLGEDWRFRADSAMGAALVVDDEPIHVGVFATLNWG